MAKKVSRAAKVPVWISYDLGSKGDFTNMYRWLKGYEALECGNSTAQIWYSKERGRKLVPSLRKEIEEAIAINAETRIFIIYRGSKNTLHEKWLIGSTNPTPAWANAQPLIV